MVKNHAFTEEQNRTLHQKQIFWDPFKICDSYAKKNQKRVQLLRIKLSQVDDLTIQQPII
jgi:hypothetical protein